MKLILRPSFRDAARCSLALELCAPSPDAPEEASRARLYGPPAGRVYSNERYAASLQLSEREREEPPSEAWLCLEERRVQLPIDGEGGTEIDFRDCYGLLRLEVECAWGDEGTPERRGLSCVADDVSVWVKRESPMNQAMRRMVEYVYSRGAYLRDTEAAGQAEERLDALLDVLESICEAYSRNLPFFKTNSHTKLVGLNKVDDFLRLQGVTPEVLQYIVQHPNELVPAEGRTGIRYGRNRYVPAHTLTGEKNRVRETYENQEVLGFIHSVALRVRERLRALDGFLAGGRGAQEEAQERREAYVDSAAFMLEKVRERLGRRRERLARTSDQLMKLYWSYREILPVEDRPQAGLPAPTQVFTEILAYRQIYDAMRSWYREGVYRLSGENFLLSLTVNHRLYEYFALFKLAEAIEASGYAYRPERSGRKLYQLRGFEKYQETKHANTFLFEKPSGGTITLYYQPVVRANYSEELSNRIALRMATSLKASFGEIEDEREGERGARNVSKFYWMDGPSAQDSPLELFYNPDYILKYSDGTRERYIIADAKFSTRRRALEVYFERLLFKYYFSIRPASPAASVAGVWILYGRSLDIECAEESILDHALPEAQPGFWLSSLSGSDAGERGEQQIQALRCILRKLTGEEAGEGAPEPEPAALGSAP